MLTKRVRKKTSSVSDGLGIEGILIVHPAAIPKLWDSQAQKHALWRRTRLKCPAVATSRVWWIKTQGRGSTHDSSWDGRASVPQGPLHSTLRAKRAPWANQSHRTCISDTSSEPECGDLVYGSANCGCCSLHCKSSLPPMV